MNQMRLSLFKSNVNLDGISLGFIKLIGYIKLDKYQFNSLHFY